MITLYGFGPKFGLPDPSPFVCKAMVLLKMAGQPFHTAAGNFSKAPKGKIPYIEDEGRLIADSTFIRRHLERRYGIYFDKGLSASQKATAWAFEKMCEEHLYWTLVDARWLDKENFDSGPRAFFAGVPAPLRPLVGRIAKRTIVKRAKAHGMGRHTKAEIEELGTLDLAAISDFLANKAWLMGDAPCGADAAVWGMVAGILSPIFTTPVRDAAQSHPNLVAYRDRGLAHWFPGFDPESAV